MNIELRFSSDNSFNKMLILLRDQLKALPMTSKENTRPLQPSKGPTDKRRKMKLLSRRKSMLVRSRMSSPLRTNRKEWRPLLLSRSNTVRDLKAESNSKSVRRCNPSKLESMYPSQSNSKKWLKSHTFTTLKNRLLKTKCSKLRSMIKSYDLLVKRRRLLPTIKPKML